MREKLSAFVISHNRAGLLESCLRAVAFADEVIVVDKSSTDGSAEVARRFASRVEVVPWTPTVEETRAYAMSLCQHEWILCLDDDEILSPETATWWRDGFDPDAADIYAMPLRHYILGVHDEAAYYWPEAHHRLFRRDAVTFIATVHGGLVSQSPRVAAIPPERQVCIHHLSYQDVASWIERTNRYTSRPNRAHAADGGDDLTSFAHARIDHWRGGSLALPGDGYPAAVALLRAIYDMVDRLKAWEAARGLDGAMLFAAAQARLVGPGGWVPERTPADGGTAAVSAEVLGVQVQLRAAEAETRERAEAVRRSETDHAATRTALAREREAVADALRAVAREQAGLAREKVAAAAAEAVAAAAAAAAAEAAAALRVVIEREQAEIVALRAAREAADQAARRDLAAARRRLEEADLDYDRLSGSARGFLRLYLPRLGQYLASQGRRIFSAGLADRRTSPGGR